jgi:glycosyltransferase involved in cell wall biosynthesis
MKSNLSVLLTTEGTYPFHQGGVSNWCDILMKEMKDVDYILYSVMANPFITPKFTLPTNSKHIKVPLWGTEEPCEHLDIPFSLVYMKKKRTTGKVIETYFLPLFKKLIFEILAPEKNPQRFGEILFQLYKYFQEYEYKESFKSEKIWQTYKEYILDFSKNQDSTIHQPDIYSLIQSLGWVYRFLNIVNTTIPKTDVTHSSASAFCGIPCVISKLENKTPFLLTEHGVYIREQYLSLSQRKLPLFLNTFLISFIQSITTLNYFFADQISPVCHYNTRWETRFGVEQQNIEVIYNGIDPTIFREAGKVERDTPTVVSVARIDPIKDTLSLIRAAAIVRENIPNVKFIVYGSVSVEAYYEECLALCRRLNLNNSFIFAGHTNDIVSAYGSGDVVALSSISEAFPYSVVEAMMTGKPVVSTDVGGVREAIGQTGYLVTPSAPDEMAAAITILLQDKNLRMTLGKEARERALSYFTLDKVINHHLQVYTQLAETAQKQIPILSIPHDNKKEKSKKSLQLLYSEKAYSLFYNGFYEMAIEQFRLSINLDPLSPSVPVFISEIANCYYELGLFENAINELAKLEIITQIQENDRIIG